MYSLTKSEANCKEMKDTKEREIVDLRDELAKLQEWYVHYIYECPHMLHYLVLHPMQLALFINLNYMLLFYAILLYTNVQVYSIKVGM